MAEIWDRGLALLGAAIGKDHPDYGNAAICGAVWKSAYNMFRIYRMRKHWDDSMLPEYSRIAEEELRNVEDVLPCVAADPEQGWHVEGDFHSFNRELLEKKMTELKNFLELNNKTIKEGQK